MYLKSNELDQALLAIFAMKQNATTAMLYKYFYNAKTSSARIKDCNLGSIMNMSGQNNTQKLTLVAFIPVCFGFSFANRDRNWCADKQDPWPPFEAVAWFQSQILPALQN